MAKIKMIDRKKIIFWSVINALLAYIEAIAYGSSAIAVAKINFKGLYFRAPKIGPGISAGTAIRKRRISQKLVFFDSFFW